MPSADTLSLLCELGIAFAALVAMFFAFSRGLGEFSVADKLRIRIVLFCCFWVVLSGMAPLLLIELQDAADALVMSALLSALAFAFISVNSFLHVLRMSPTDRRSVRDLNFYLSWGLGLGIFAALGMLLLQIRFAREGGVYLLAVSLGLGLCMTNFVTTAFDRLFRDDVE